MSQSEFAFNNSVNRTTGYALVEVVYGFQPRTPIDLPSLLPPRRVSEAAEDLSRYMVQMH